MKARQLWEGVSCGLDPEPLMDRHRIEERQEIIQVFLDHFFERSDLADRLKGCL